jgi:hypothetical protein
MAADTFIPPSEVIHGDGEPTTLSHVRKRIAMEAVWELDALATVLPTVVPHIEEDQGPHYAVRGIAARLKVLSQVLMSALDDDATHPDELARKLMLIAPN